MNSAGLKIGSVTEQLGQAMLRIVPRTAVVRVLSGPLRGRKWIAGASTNSCWLGVYEMEKQNVFRSLIRPRDVVYDLGANVGFYSLLASVLVGPQGRVFSFEPLPRNLALLRRHLGENRITNCVIVASAVSNREGIAPFEAQCDPHMTKLSATGNITVTLASLDDLLGRGEILPPNVIKCDIEGAEFDALIGARTLLERYHPTILLATHGRTVHTLCCDFLLARGYSVRALAKGMPLAQSTELVATPSTHREPDGFRPL
jgi:FkbM family methyltransferase